MVHVSDMKGLMARLNDMKRGHDMKMDGFVEKSLQEEKYQTEVLCMLSSFLSLHRF